MHKLHLLLAPLRRIHAVLPSSLQRGIRTVFVLMTLLGLVELASIMALTGFFTILNDPAHFAALGPVRKAQELFPSAVRLPDDPRRILLWACLCPIGLIVLKNLLSALVAWRSAMLGERVAAHVGSGIMQRYLHMPYSRHLSAQSSLALTAMQWRFNLGQMLLQLLAAYSNLITVVLLFGGLMLYAPGVTISVAGFMLLIAAGTYQVLRRRIDRAASKAALAQQEENSAMMTAVGGVREVIIYQQQPVFLEAVHRQVRAGMKPRSFLGVSAAVPTWTLESGGFFLIWLGIFLMIHVQDAVLPAIAATVALLALTAWRVLPALNRVVGATVNIRSLQSTALSCLDYFESLAASPTETPVAPAENFRIRREIVFEHVCYRYPGADRDALNDITCRIPLGTTLGLVGRSGAGKSTFINILSGLLEPTSGRLLVDGKPMSAAELAAYRKQIGYVPQSPYVLAGTAAQNVAFSDWGKPPNVERVRRACREAAVDFLGPDCANINRPVNSNNLSGGQMQRLSIARALYVDPVLLIFDEATSALDQGTEAEVQQAMIRSKGKRTNVIAAHRLNTLEICDSVLWLEEGRIVRIGKNTAGEYIKSIYDKKILR